MLSGPCGSLVFSFGAHAVNSTPHRARVTPKSFSRVWLKDLRRVQGHIVAAFCCLSYNSHARERMSCRTLGLIARFFLCRTVLFLHTTLQTGQLPAFPQQGLVFGSFAEQSPLTGYEPNAPVKVGRYGGYDNALTHEKKQALVRLTPLARTSSLLPLYRRVDERSNLGMLPSPLLTLQTQVQPHSNRESSATRSSHVPTSTERPVAMSSNNKIESRLKCCAGVLFRKRTGFFLSIEKSTSSLNCELIMLFKEKELLYEDEIASSGNKESYTV